MLLVKIAESAEPAGIDLQALPLPLSAETGSMLESSVPQTSGDFKWALRTSGLRRPLTLRLPSPSPEGTSVGLIEGVVLSELSANVGLGEGWDAGFGFGVHVSQSQVESTDANSTARFRGRDPRLGIGWGRNFGAISLRPFAQLYVPLGDDESFAGEPSARALLGFVSSLDADFLRLTVETAFLSRKSQRISSTTWGPQLLVGTGVFVPVFGTVEVGAQIVILPVVSRQEGLSGSRGGRIMPGEALGGLRHTFGSLSCGLGMGLGLPLSRTSSIHTDQKSVRGPTTPVYRGFFDLTYQK